MQSLMTPRSILDQTEFLPAQTITPEYFSDFNSLLAVRDDIRDLKILPIKTFEMRQRYKLVVDVLLEGLLRDMEGMSIFYAENKYPYFLPDDVEQGLVWCQSGVVDAEVTEFVEWYLEYHGISQDEVIIFERPKNTTTSLVKGTFPAMRHIHIWSRKSTINLT